MKINEFKIAFVGGIHGVGKSSFSSEAARILKIPRISASTLITQQLKAPAAINKRVKDVAENQNALILAIEAQSDLGVSFILDGHFCVFNSSSHIQRISSETFRQLAPVSVVILTDEASAIRQRLNNRDHKDFPTEILDELQKAEISHAKTVCNQWNIPIFVARPSEHKVALDFIHKHLNQKQGV